MSKPTGGMMADRSQRSVFVGNISYEVGEEQLRQVFTQVGQVINLRMVHDRDTGKPKGYGFCEYVDVQSAEAAIRGLNGYELNGRSLRVDSAAGSDRNTEEVQQLQIQMAAQQRVEEENPYGSECEPSKAPESITRSVASLPPEQMFELMRQMKECVKNNPSEAKQMLLSNPQLGYALLQAQVVMRIIDPQSAIAMLHREPPNIRNTPFHLQTQASSVSSNPPPSAPVLSAVSSGYPPTSSVPPSSHFPPQQVPPHFPSHANAPAPTCGVSPSLTQAARSANAAAPSDEDEQNAQLLKQVLLLSEEQIAALPAEDRHVVLELRNKLRKNI